MLKTSSLLYNLQSSMCEICPVVDLKEKLGPVQICFFAFQFIF